MLSSMEKKGKKIFMNGEDLHEYMFAKLNELSGLIANMIVALIITSLVIVFNFFRAGDMYYYALILLPLLARWYLGGMVNQYLRKKFKALLYT
jgi:hypothetical protein